MATRDIAYGAERLAEQIEAALRWLATLGVVKRETRFELYARTLRRLAARVRSGDDVAPGPDEPTLMRDFMACVEDGLALPYLHRHLGYAVTRELRRRLAHFVGGPLSSAAETSRSSWARNIGAELIAGASLRASGLVVEFPEDGDLTVRLGNTATVLIECKRPQGLAGIQRAIEDADDQVGQRMNGVRRGLISGGAYLEIGKVVTQGHLRMTGRDRESAFGGVKAELRTFVHEHGYLWQRSRHDNLLWVIVALSCPAVLHDGGSAWLHPIVFNPLEANLSPEHRERLEALPVAFQDLVLRSPR